MGNISSINSINSRAYVSGTTETQKVEGREDQPVEKNVELTPSDKVSLSKESKDIQLAKEAVAAEPDIRADIVDPIKQKIADGTYEVNAEKVAENLIGTQISEMV